MNRLTYPIKSRMKGQKVADLQDVCIFQSIPATDSIRFRPVIPGESGQ